MERIAVQTEFIDKEEERLKAYYDLLTQFSEIVDGNMRTSFDLSFDGHDLYAPDGRGLDEVTLNGLKSAEKAAELDPRLAFGVRRSILERQERDEAIKIARGYGPNTMVIISDYPEELANTKQDIGGYNSKRKQCMMRVFLRQSDGSVKMTTQSLDGSDRKALESIYDRYNVKPQPGELLGQRLQLHLDNDAQENLIDEITSIYDQALVQQFGGEWYAGRNPADIRNTFDFVSSQEDLIEACLQLQLEGKLTDSVMYNVAATMQNRFKSINKAKSGPIKRQFDSGNYMALRQEIIDSGLKASLRGDIFSFCGGNLQAESFNKLEGFDVVGYTPEETNQNCDFISKMCPQCKAKNVKTHVTATHISGSCGCKKKRTS